MVPEFEKWPSTPRASKMQMVITEKIDGTNACVIFDDDGQCWAQSRNRMITVADDNAGFARWVSENSETLFSILGPGRHYGEWWGSGIQRGYGLTKGEKRFSLFNTRSWRWMQYLDSGHAMAPLMAQVPALGVVPVLRLNVLDTAVIESTLTLLGAQGSSAAPGYMNPEGICVFLPDFGRVMKKTFDGDNHKGEL